MADVESANGFSERGSVLGMDLFGTAFLRSPRIVRWGGFLAASGGAMFLVASFVSFGWMAGWIPQITPGYEMFAEEYAAKRMLNMLYALTAPGGGLLVATGMVGVCALLAMRPGGRPGLARAGVLLAVASCLCAAVLTVYEFMPRYFERDPVEFLASQSAYSASFLGWMCGVSLAGFAALRARSLGKWRFLPAPLALLCLPVRQAMLLLMYPTGPLLLTEPGFVFAAVVEAPRALGGCGWILFGIALSRARERELDATRKENLALVRRFYEEAWGKGNLDLVDEILAPDFVDHHHSAEGAENFKHYLADLRATFPDLRLAIQSQSADGDEIATRCEIHGTDKGGVLYHPPTNKTVAFAAIFTDTVRDGRISEHRGYVDEGALFEQLGLKNRESGAGRVAPFGRSGE